MSFGLKWRLVALVLFGLLAGSARLASAAVPAMPTPPDLIAASDSGISNTDNITSVTTPSFTGTAEPNVTVNLLVDGAMNASGTADAAGAYTLTSTTLTGGTYAISAQAIDSLGNPGPVSASLTVTIDTTSPTVTLTARPPTLTNNRNPRFTFSGSETGVAFACALAPNATTFTPCSSPQDYTGLADGAYTFQVKATDAAGNTSATVSASFTLDATPPVVTITTQPPAFTNNPNLGFSFGSEPGVTFACSLTTNGSTFVPCASPQSYTGLADGAYTFQVTATDAAGNVGGPASYSVTVDTVAPRVSASPPGGLYTGPQTIDLTANELATIYFTDDGTDPATSPTREPYWPQIKAAVEVTSTLRFIAIDRAGNQSPVVSEVYILDQAPPRVTVTPPGGVYNQQQSVTLAPNEPATIRYTLDGSTPTPISGTLYNGPITIARSLDLKFIAIDRAGNQSAVSTERYTIDAQLPVVLATPPGGFYRQPQTVTLTSSKAVTILFTTNGADPATSGARYSAPLSIGGEGVTILKYIAVDLAGNRSPVVTETYTIDRTAPTVGVSPPGGAYNAPQTVTLTVAEPATIYYTLDGATPTTASAVYGAPLTIATSTTLQFFAVDWAGNRSQVVVQSYTIDTTVLTLSVNPPPGTYTTPPSITLSTSKPATLFYTTDGTRPTPASPRYTAPILLTAEGVTTLSVLAVDAIGATASRTLTYTLTTGGRCGRWSCWNSLGGILTDAPAAASLPGRLLLFAKGSDNALYVTSSIDGVGFSAWTRLGGILTAAPAATNYQNQVYIFAKGSDNALYVMRSPDGVNFSTWTRLGGILTAPPAAASVNGVLYVLAKGSDNALYLKRSTDGVNFGEWQNLGGLLTAAPAATSFNGQLYVFAKGSDNALYEKHGADGVTFTEWNRLGGVLTAAPAAASYTPLGGSPTLTVLARGSDGALWLRQSVDGARYSDWFSLGGELVGPPAATTMETRLVVVARWRDDTLAERHTLP